MAVLSVFQNHGHASRGKEKTDAKKKATKPFPRSRGACLRGPVDDSMECVSFSMDGCIPLPEIPAGDHARSQVLRGPLLCVFQKGKVFLMAGSLQTGGTQNLPLQGI